MFIYYNLHTFIVKCITFAVAGYYGSINLLQIEHIDQHIIKKFIHFQSKELSVLCILTINIEKKPLHCI